MTAAAAQNERLGTSDQAMTMTMTTAVAMTIDALLDDAIQALATVDAARMESLIAASHHVVATPVECRDARPKQQVLGQLLRETSRNIRLLRRIEAGPEQLLRYGPR